MRGSKWKEWIVAFYQLLFVEIRKKFKKDDFFFFSCDLMSLLKFKEFKYTYNNNFIG